MPSPTRINARQVVDLGGVQENPGAIIYAGARQQYWQTTLSPWTRIAGRRPAINGVNKLAGG